MTTAAYQRLLETGTFRNDGFVRWELARLAIIGCGMLGSRLAVEAVRSGTSVRLYDFDQIEPHNNLATPATAGGDSKIDALVSACDAIRPAAASGLCADILHVGIGDLADCDLLVDCTDDPRLGFPLTMISNGLQLPLLRVAVDGTGQWEMGRVLCSDARDGGSCQMCTRSFEDLARGVDRTPCPGAPTAERPPTLAGGALASTIAGIALLQAQRLVTGNDLELVRDREVIADLSHHHMMGAEVSRSADCISGHETWETADMPANACHSLEDVFDAATGLVGRSDLSLEAYNHPFCVEARCKCGARRVALGTVWAAPPICEQCGRNMIWRTESQMAALHRGQAAHLGALQNTLAELGLPATGAMFVARVAHQSPTRMVLHNGPTRH